MTRTASCYTHKVQVVSTAQNLKVEYPGKIAVTPQPLAPTLPCYPSYLPITYVPAATCPSYKPACARPINPEFLFQWRFVENNANPGPGEFSIENSNNYVRISNTDLSGSDQTSFLNQIRNNGFIIYSNTAGSTSVISSADSNDGAYHTIQPTSFGFYPNTSAATFPNYLFSYTLP